MTPATSESVAWTLSLLDEESSGDRDVLADVAARGEPYIAWLGDPSEMRPIAMAGIGRDAHAWMVTTKLLQVHKAQRQLLRVMRMILGRAVMQSGLVWGVVCRTHSTVRLLDLLGAEFRASGDGECVWTLRDNRRLWRTI